MAFSDSGVLSCRAGKGSWAAGLLSGLKVQPSAVQVTLHVAVKAGTPETS